jgi:hypothetical protein
MLYAHFRKQREKYSQYFLKTYGILGLELSAY